MNKIQPIHQKIFDYSMNQGKLLYLWIMYDKRFVFPAISISRSETLLANDYSFEP